MRLEGRVAWMEIQRNKNYFEERSRRLKRVDWAGKLMVDLCLYILASVKSSRNRPKTTIIWRYLSSPASERNVGLHPFHQPITQTLTKCNSSDGSELILVYVCVSAHTKVESTWFSNFKILFRLLSHFDYCFCRILCVGMWYRFSEKKNLRNSFQTVSAMINVSV